jgi:cyclin D6
MKDAGPTLVGCLDSSDRDKVALRIIEICEKKNYKDETCFLAIKIFDKFFS